MGGNALSRPSVRLSKKEYNDVLIKVLDVLYDALPDGVQCAPTQSYVSKDSFGDMDILIETHEGYDPQNLTKLLEAVEVVCNGDVTSLGIPYGLGLFQINLIKVKNFEFAYVYFSGNDMGNLMGKIAHKMGFKYGHEGLKYVIRDPEDDTHVLSEVVITDDPEKAMTFIGYDYRKYQETVFVELEDIFEFVADNFFFNKDIYLFDNLNHTSRVRDRKRKTYCAFLEWCREREFSNHYPWGDDAESKKSTKNDFLASARFEFDEFNAAYQREMGRLKIRKESKTKFNGAIVSEFTGLESKELGQWIAAFKKSWIYEDHFHHWVVTVPQEEINKAIQFNVERQRDA